MIRATIAAALLFPLAAHSAAYRCEVGGEITLSDRPCGAQAESITIPSAPPAAQPSADGLRPAERARLRQIEAVEQRRQAEEQARNDRQRIQRQLQQERAERLRPYRQEYCQRYTSKADEYANIRRQGCTRSECERLEHMQRAYQRLADDNCDK